MTQPSAWIGRIWLLGCKAWIGFCVAALFFMLLCRVLHYASLSLPEPLDDFIGVALAHQFLLFGQVSALVTLTDLIVLASAALGIVYAIAYVFLRWRWGWRFFPRHEGQWGLRWGVLCVIWAGLAFSHYFFDQNAWVGWGALAAVALASPYAWERVKHREVLVRRLYVGACAVLFAVWILGSRDLGHSVGIAVFGLLLMAVWWGPWRLFWRDRLWLAMALIPPIQMFAAWLPALLEPPFDGEWLGGGMAYSFCEAPQHDQLFVAVTGCFTVPVMQWRECMDGEIAEYALGDLTLRKRHSMFSDSFFGRMEQLICLQDTVQVGMSSAIIDGVDLEQNAMEFDMANPTDYRPNLVGEKMGDRIAYDSKNDALYYVGEWSHEIVRVDRKTGEVQRHPGRWDGAPIYVLWLSVPGSLVLSQYSIHEERDSIFMVEWIAGRYVHEMSLSEMELVGRIKTNNGGTLGLTVDEELNRLYLAGLWGIEVIDLDTGEPIHRIRSGFFGRVPVLDTKHDLVYVPSTVEGRIRVFDRHSMKLLGMVPTGYGTRHPYLSKDKKRFFAGSAAGFYWIDAEAMAAEFASRR